MAGKLKISKGQKGQKKVTHEKKRRRQNNKSNEILFRATLVLFILQRRVDRGARAQEARWREKKKKKEKEKKESSYFCNCFFFHECWEKSGGESFEKFKQTWQPGCSGINLFKQGENPAIINTDGGWNQLPCCIKPVYRCCQIKKPRYKLSQHL